MTMQPQDEEGSLFETAADFFSLLALSAIFAVITFGAQSAGQSAAGIRSGAGAGVATDPEDDVVYIAFGTQSEYLRVTVIDSKSGQLTQRSYAPAADNAHQIVDEIIRSLPPRTNFEKIKCRLDSQEDRAEVHRTFLLLLRSLQADGMTVEAGV